MKSIVSILFVCTLLIPFRSFGQQSQEDIVNILLPPREKDLITGDDLNKIRLALNNKYFKNTIDKSELNHASILANFLDKQKNKNDASYNAVIDRITRELIDTLQVSNIRDIDKYFIDSLNWPSNWRTSGAGSIGANNFPRFKDHLVYSIYRNYLMGLEIIAEEVAVVEETPTNELNSSILESTINEPISNIYLLASIIGLALLFLIFSIINFLKLRKLTKLINLLNENLNNSTLPVKGPKKKTSLRVKIQEDLKNLELRLIEKITNVINSKRLVFETTLDKGSQDELKSFNSSTADGIKYADEKFAPPPNNEGIFLNNFLKKSFMNKKTIFVIKVRANNSDEADLFLTENSETRQMAFDIPGTFLPSVVCDIRGQGPISDTTNNIRIVRGKLKKFKGRNWKIDEKMIIDYS